MKKLIPCLSLLIIIYILLGATLPYASHKSSSTKKDSPVFASDAADTERVSYISDNSEALLYRLQLISEAQSELIMSTFDFADDEAGQTMIGALLKAADRGVQLRLVVDGLSGLMDMCGSRYFKALAQHENSQVRIYNPIDLLRPWSLPARMHDKYIIADDFAYILGGRNTSNLFLGDFGGRQNIDRDLLVYAPGAESGRSIEQLKAYFESIWDLTDCRDYAYLPLGSNALQRVQERLYSRYETIARHFELSEEGFDWDSVTAPAARISLLTNPPTAGNKEPQLWNSLVELMSLGERAVIHTPYIIFGSEMYSDISGLCADGKQIQLFTNDVSGGANGFGSADYLNNRRRILASGVTVSEMKRERSLHSKCAVIDDNISIVGSFNMDMRSAYIDTELMLVVDSPYLNAELKAETEDDIQYSKTLSFEGGCIYGENYTQGRMALRKGAMIFLLRMLTPPIRFLL